MTLQSAGFFADPRRHGPTCDLARPAGEHAIFVWSFTGTHAGTANPLSVPGREERTFDGDGRVLASLGWFDADDYRRRVDGGG